MPQERAQETDQAVASTEQGAGRRMLCLSLARDSLRIVSQSGLTWLESVTLSRLPWLAHGFSTRVGPRSGYAGAGERECNGFNLGLTPGANPRTVERNRQLLSAGLGRFRAIASLHQIHSTVVYQVTRSASGPAEADPLPLDYLPAGWPLPAESQDKANREAARGKSPAGDALFSAEAGVLLTVRVADCLPVVIADKRLRVVAAIHAAGVAPWPGSSRRPWASCAASSTRIPVISSHRWDPASLDVVTRLAKTLWKPSWGNSARPGRSFTSRLSAPTARCRTGMPCCSTIRRRQAMRGSNQGYTLISPPWLERNWFLPGSSLQLFMPRAIARPAGAISSSHIAATALAPAEWWLLSAFADQTAGMRPGAWPGEAKLSCPQAAMMSCPRDIRMKVGMPRARRCSSKA
jgi:hypothetical protein